MNPYPNKNHILYTVIITVMTAILFVFGLYLTLAGSEGALGVIATSINFYIFLLHPLVFFLIGRLLVKTATIETFPKILLIVILLLPAVPITYITLPSITNIFEITMALEIVFLVFEGAALLATILFFIHYLRRYIHQTLEPRDLYAIHHFLIGSLVYFYFIRLTLLSSIQLSSAFEAL
ncbi:MAG: hypothetical protein ACLFUQ_00200 [Candidatus Izemoplasmataceae bacterium]